jgi:hypothetical protein
VSSVLFFIFKNLNIKNKEAKHASQALLAYALHGFFLLDQACMPQSL